jgi:asparagine synthase (glutamine-hydrolysing)
MKPDILEQVYDDIQTKVYSAVQVRIPQNSKIGLLFSGGFDSALLLAMLINAGIREVDLFTVGDYHSNDVKSAKNLVKYLEQFSDTSIKHHIVSVSNQCICDTTFTNIQCITEKDYSIENDIPFYFLFQYIKNTGVNVLFSGDGLDEICGKELVKLNAQDFQNKSINLLENIHDKICAFEKLACCNGLEIRYPYLDMNFVEYMLSLHPTLKRAYRYPDGQYPIEKYIIRQSFVNNKHISKASLWRTSSELSKCLNHH